MSKYLRGKLLKFRRGATNTPKETWSDRYRTCRGPSRLNAAPTWLDWRPCRCSWLSQVQVQIPLHPWWQRGTVQKGIFICVAFFFWNSSALLSYFLVREIRWTYLPVTESRWLRHSATEDYSLSETESNNLSFSCVRVQEEQHRGRNQNTVL